MLQFQAWSSCPVRAAFLSLMRATVIWVSLSTDLSHCCGTWRNTHTHTYINTLEYTNRCAKIIKCEWTCAFSQCSHQQTSNRLWYLAAQEKKGQASYCAHRVSGFVFMSFVQDLGVISLNVFMPPRLYVLLHQWLIAAQLFWSSHLVFSV